MFSHESMQTVAEGIFWFFVLVTFCGAVLAVSARTLIRRVAGLALCFTGVAGLYYYLSSPFVAFMQMLVYVGALCVTITFAIMLAEEYYTNKNYSECNKWALIANNIDAENEKSWIWFAKSKVKLGQKNDAILALKTYLKSNKSQSIQSLLNQIMVGEPIN